jgi:hypothetical protein
MFSQGNNRLINKTNIIFSGMQPVLFSVTEAVHGRVGWVRAGHAQKTPEKNHYQHRFVIDKRSKK